MIIKNEQNLSGLLRNNHRTKICVISVPEDRKEYAVKNFWRKIAEILPSVAKA